MTADDKALKRISRCRTMAAEKGLSAARRCSNVLRARRKRARKGSEMMWHNASRFALAACVAAPKRAAEPAGTRRAMKWLHPGVSWRNG